MRGSKETELTIRLDNVDTQGFGAKMLEMLHRSSVDGSPIEAFGLNLYFKELKKESSLVDCNLYYQNYETGMVSPACQSYEIVFYAKEAD